MPLAHKYMTADFLGLSERDLPETKAPIWILFFTEKQMYFSLLLENFKFLR
jgi:hypothetical protein